MILKESEVITRIQDTKRQQENPLMIIPCPYPRELLDNPLSATGAGSVELRLGTWFLVAQLTKTAVLEISRPSRLQLELEDMLKKKVINEATKEELERRLGPKLNPNNVAKPHHVRFGNDFVLHPRSFALASTLEWMRIPTDLAGYVIGKSSWGRRGLIIATAAGVHPGFTGCLTLELANLGDIPIVIRPGMTIAQLFLHTVAGPTGSDSVDRSAFSCKRRPILGEVIQDDIAMNLAKAHL